MHDDRPSRGITLTTAKGQHLRYNGGGHPQQCRDQPDMVRCTPTLLAPYALTFPLFNYNSFTAPGCSPDESTQKLVSSQVSQASGAPPCKSESRASGTVCYFPWISIGLKISSMLPAPACGLRSASVCSFLCMGSCFRPELLSWAWAAPLRRRLVSAVATHCG